MFPMLPKGSFIFRRMVYNVQTEFLARKLERLRAENSKLATSIQNAKDTASLDYFLDRISKNNANIQRIKEKLLAKE